MSERKDHAERENLEALASRMEAKGAKVIVKIARAGWVASVQIENAVGIGSHEMSPAKAAERMREWLAA